jgi:hypothetical protein
MAYNALAVAIALKSMVAALSGMSAAQVQIGAPLTIGPRLFAYVTLGSQPLVRKATGLVQRSSRFMVTFCYRIDADRGASEVATGEAALMQVVDLFLQALHNDPTIGATCNGSEVDTGLADSPEYTARGNLEYREYPVIVTARQQTSHAT